MIWNVHRSQLSCLLILPEPHDCLCSGLNRCGIPYPSATQTQDLRLNCNPHLAYPVLIADYDCLGLRLCNDRSGNVESHTV